MPGSSERKVVMHNFKVTGRPLVHNGRALKVGAKLSLSAADGKILADRGRVDAASGKAKDSLESEPPAE
jgi:hypothetical protein